MAPKRKQRPGVETRKRRREREADAPASLAAIQKAKLNCQINNAMHRTLDITAEQLVVRRGQPFLLTLEMSQPFTKGDPLSITVVTGSHPSETRGTRSVFGNPCPMWSSDVRAVWTYEIHSSSVLQRGSITLAVTPAADAPVGKYFMSGNTGGGKDVSLGSLVVLFNPWCSEDWIYLADEQERQEYVMNEHGVIYTGASHYIQSMNWDYGQFEENMVDICLKLLDINPKHKRDAADDVSARCNPIYVSRVVSTMINCNGDRGVLLGRWDGDYSDGFRPSHWTGSADILSRWYQSDCHPVIYGQCWVFAAVMCTVLRFLGIPCRVVTNFDSAHDTDNSLTIDTFYGDDGVLPKDSEDRIWNFHVWVEAWMKRPDLNKDGSYDGWQVLDPTPQELSPHESRDVFCCGPAPVAAILQGHVNMKYDIPFVFSEVNADCVTWLVSADGSKTKIQCDTKTVGEQISTKSVGSNVRKNITHLYKHSEGSLKERAAYKQAVNRMNCEEEVCEPDRGKGGQPEVKMIFQEERKPQSGQDILLALKLHSLDRVDRTLSIHVNIQAMQYTGIPAKTIQTYPQEKKLQRGKDLSIPVVIPFSVYGKYMLDCDSLKVSAVAKDKQSPEHIYMAEMDIVLQDPPISISVLGQARQYHEMTVEVVFENPVNETLRNCYLTITGSGLLRNSIEERFQEVLPGSRVQKRITLTPYKTGLRTLLADFDCSTFKDIKGSCTVEVRPYIG